MRHTSLLALTLLACTLTSRAQDTGPTTPQQATYDPAIFQRAIDPAQLTSLKQFAGQPSGVVYDDKQFHKLLKAILPDCTFHYGSDMPLSRAMDTVFAHSDAPVALRAGRYLTLSGHSGPYLAGRGFLWIDLQEGVALGAFYFRPTNGEPTPSLTVFSRMINADNLTMGQLPPAFAEDLFHWSDEDAVPVVSTRYFISGGNRKLLLEHDEDYCKPASSAMETMGDCEQQNADAADFDLTAAEYLEATHYATNGTAWMISGEDRAWLGVRDRTCGGVADPLPCRIRITRERTHLVLHRPFHK